MNNIKDAIDKLEIYKVEAYDFIKMDKIELDKLKELINHLMAAKERNQATELLSKVIKDKFRIYSIRDDDRKELWIFIEGVYVPNGATYIQQFCRFVLEGLFTTHICNEVIDKIRADSYIDHKCFFNQSYTDLVVVENGILNVMTKEITPFDPEKVFFNKLPVKYSSKKDCPMIKQFLKDILEDEDDFLVIQEMFGDLLYNEYKWERCFMFLGDGRNGKSKLGDLIKLFIGTDSCCNVHPSTLEDPDSFTISHFFGKRANVSLDINSTALRNISMIKSLSGRDIITAQRKFKTPIDFENKALLIFGANELPVTYDTKNAFWERWILINFPFTFVSENDYITAQELNKLNYKKRDPSIIKKITTKEELSGLLNFALEGLKRLEKKGTYSYKYTPEEVRSQWIMKSDSFAAFFYTYLEHDYDGKIKKADLKKYYADFCRLKKVKPMTDKSINRTMTEQGISDDTDRSNGWFSYWTGVKIKDKYSELDEFNFSKMIEVEGQSKLSFTKKITEEKIV